MDRKQLLATAVTVGLIIGVDFEKNISSVNLQKKIEEKQEQLANSLKGVQVENVIDAKFADIESWINNPTTEQLENIAVALFKRTNVSIDDIKYFFLKQKVEQEQIDSINFDNVVEQVAKESETKNSLDAKGDTTTKITDEKKIKELDDNALIKRETVCKSYRTKIKGFEEAARRSNLTVEEVKESIDSGNPVGGYLFTFIG